VSPDRGRHGGARPGNYGGQLLPEPTPPGRDFLDYAGRDNGGRLLQLSQQHEDLLKLLYEPPSAGTDSTGKMVFNRDRETVADQIHDIRREIRDLGGEPLPWLTDADE